MASKIAIIGGAVMFECPDCEQEYSSVSAVMYCDCDKDDVRKLEPWQESE